MLPAKKVNEKLQNNYITATEIFSAAARYTEALVKKLEELYRSSFTICTNF
jgi:DNA topoisomerase-1